MDDRQFDLLTRRLGGRMSRRGASRILAGGAATLLAAGHRGTAVANAYSIQLGEACIRAHQCNPYAVMSSHSPYDQTIYCDYNGIPADGEFNCCRYYGGDCATDGECCGYNRCLGRVCQ